MQPTPGQQVAGRNAARLRPRRGEAYSQSDHIGEKGVPGDSLLSRYGEGRQATSAGSVPVIGEKASPVGEEVFLRSAESVSGAILMEIDHLLIRGGGRDFISFMPEGYEPSDIGDLSSVMRMGARVLDANGGGQVKGGLGIQSVRQDWPTLEDLEGADHYAFPQGATSSGNLFLADRPESPARNPAEARRMFLTVLGNIVRGKIHDLREAEKLLGDDRIAVGVLRMIVSNSPTMSQRLGSNQ